MEKLTVKEVAEMLKMEMASIGKQIRKGKYPNAYKEKGKWIIPKKDFEEYMKQKQNVEEIKENCLSVKEMAKIFNKNEETIKTWLKKGLFPNAFKGKNKEWFVPKGDYEEIASLPVVDERMIEKHREVVGNKYEYLTILELLGYKKDGKGQRIYAKVGCECGNIVEKHVHVITSGRMKCCSNECIMKSGLILGERFGWLTIIGDGGLRQFGNRKTKIRFAKVKCDCGEIKEVPLTKLKTEAIRSCGGSCPVRAKDLRIDMIGKKYGSLTVVEEIGKRDNNRWFICRCDCGNIADKEMSKLRNGHTKYCGLGCKIYTGPNHASWKSEITMEERIKGRDYYEYNQWRNKVYQRDEYTCVKCGVIGMYLNARHKDGYDWCKEKRTEVDNGATLCEDCHTDFHKEYGYGNNTNEQYEEWMNKENI